MVMTTPDSVTEAMKLIAETVGLGEPRNSEIAHDILHALSAAGYTLAPSPTPQAVEALREALELAANRLARLALNAPQSSREWYEISDWALEARRPLISTPSPTDRLEEKPARHDEGEDEATGARILANKILDRPWADPDDDLAVLARQLLRADEKVDKLREGLKPFAQFANALTEQVRDDIALAIVANGVTHFGPGYKTCVGDLRRARSLTE